MINKTISKSKKVAKQRSEEVQKCIHDKWIPILQGKHTPKGVDDCHLCKKYLSPEACKLCPVKSYTGTTLCGGSPNKDFSDLHYVFLESEIYHLHAEVTAAAQWEIDFLNEVKQAELAKESK